MESLAFREIFGEPEVEIFLSRFQDYVGVKLPNDYAKNSKIVGAFLHGRMVAGYMLVLSPPFRSLLFVPDKVKHSDPFFSKSPYEMMEINGLWISSSLRSPKLQMSVWFHLVSNIFLSKKKYVLLLRDSRNKTMGRLLGLAKPKVLYDGAPLLMAGEQTHSRIQLSYTSRWNILINSYKYWLELRRRRGRAKSFVPRPSNFSNIRPAKQSHPELIK
jgi:hypothetical protein